MKQSISIIICTHNRQEHLRATLESIEHCVVPEAFSAELVVVDNASTDDTANVIKARKLLNMPVRYVYEPRPGQSNARNTGIAQSNGDIILFTDDGVRPPQNWTTDMCNPILLGQADAVRGGVRVPANLRRSWMTDLHLGWLAESDFNWEPGRQTLTGANMAFTRAVLEKVPAFDPQLGPGALGFKDDTLFALQLKKAGYRIAKAPGACVEHHFDPSRLLRASWLSDAKKRGRSEANLKHHWHHEISVSSYWRLAFVIARLTYWRIRRVRDCLRREGIAEWEMGLVQSVAFCRQYRKERKRPRNYEKQGFARLYG